MIRKILVFIAIPLTVYAILNILSEQRAIDICERSAEEMREVGHPISVFSQFHNLVLSSDFIEKIEVLDFDGRVLYAFPNVGTSEKYGVIPKTQKGIEKIGFLAYRIGQKYGDYTTVFTFKNKDGVLLFTIFTSIFWMLFLYSIWLIKIEFYKREKEFHDIVSLNTAIKVHEITGPLKLASDILSQIDDASLTNKIDTFFVSSKMIKALFEEVLAYKKPTIQSVAEINFKQLVELYFSVFGIKKDVTVIKKFNHIQKIYGDVPKMDSIVRNLLSNAIKHSDEFVIIKTFDGNKGVYLDISNTGKPIPEKQKKLLFQPYVTFSNGRGVGLAAVKRFVELHDGRVSILNRDEMVTFRCFFPCKIQTTPSFCNEPPIKSQSLQQDGSMKVAVLDDEECFIENFKTSSDVSVSGFSHPDTLCMSLIEGNCYDAIVLDALGPGFNTVDERFPELLRSELGVKCPIIFYSSFPLMDDQKKMYDAVFQKLDTESVTKILSFVRRRFLDLAERNKSREAF